MIFASKAKYTFIIFISILNILIAREIEDIAYQAYQEGDYTKALMLYKEGAKANSLKSYLMIGVFLEKGIALKADKTKAIQTYRLLLKKAKEDKETYKNLKKVDILILALQRLYLLTGKREYYNLLIKLENIKTKLQEKK